MNPEEWKRIEALFHQLESLPEREREDHLAQECGDDPERAALLRNMLARAQSEVFEPVTPARLLSALGAGDLSGRQLAEFELEEEIGRGGMGVVYRARQVGLERWVAVKVLPPPLEDVERFVERFRREALAASRLQHPGVVQVLSAGESEGLLYYAMELVDGWSLQELLVAQRSEQSVPEAPDVREPRVAAGLCRQLALALEHAHERGVLHRDLKPQNILIQGDSGLPRLIDFGLARIESLDSISRTGDLAGTPLYMSPEQVRASPGGIDKRTDVYSAGAVLYELLTDSPPFPGDSAGEVMVRITQGQLRPVRKLAPGVPSGLARACEMALERDPEDRYASAREFADDLARASRGERVRARPSPLKKRLQRKITRRALLLGAPPAIVLGALGGYWARRPVRAAGKKPTSMVPPPSPRASGQIQLAGGEASGLRAWVFPWEGGEHRFSQPLALGELLPGKPRRVIAGPLRLVMVDDEDRYSELWREIMPTRKLEIARPQLASRSQVEQGMAYVHDGGPRCTDVVWTPTVEGFEATRATEWRSRPKHEPFLIDLRPVTNGEYRSYRESLGEFPPSDWPEGRQRLWTEPPRDDWEDLPVTGVTWDEARSFAEGMGKRLPTLQEWNMVMGMPALRWVTDAMRSAESTPFNMGKSMSRTDWPAYVEHVRAVGGDRPPASPPLAPFGMVETFGNVWEWLEDPGPVPATRTIQGGAWHTPVDTFFRNTLQRPAFSGRNDPGSADRGFRCAKSARPPDA